MNLDVPPVGPIDIGTQHGVTLLTCRGCELTLAFHDGRPEWLRRSWFREFVHQHRNCRVASSLTPREAREAEEASCRA